MKALLEESLEYLSKYGTNFDLEKRIIAELAKHVEPVAYLTIDAAGKEHVHLGKMSDSTLKDWNIKQQLPLFTNPPAQQSTLSDAIAEIVWRDDGYGPKDTLNFIENGFYHRHAAKKHPRILLYTHPPAQQKPLSIDEIKTLWEESLLNTNSYTLKFARAIEKAHGIGSNHEPA